MTRRVVVPIVTVAVLLAVVLTYATVRAAGRGAALPDYCADYTAVSVDRLAHDVGPTGGPRVVVIGDSYAMGFGIDRSETSWPSRLPGRVHVAGFSGSGFSAGASECPGESYADRAAAAVRGGAALVVVEGGLNDTDRSEAEIRTGFARLMRVLAGQQVLVVGPAPAPALVDGVPRVGALLGELARDAGVGYLSMAHADLDYVSDRVHPSAAGHRVFGDRVAEAISRRGLLDGTT